jgi:glucose/arabinose dehydrogenase
MTPQETLLAKAIQGDTSDNLPGLIGVGEKTAADAVQKQHGGIWRFKADVPNQEQLKDGYRYASGLRHVLSLAWNPTKQAFFMVMMGRDQLNTTISAPRI